MNALNTQPVYDLDLILGFGKPSDVPLPMGTMEHLTVRWGGAGLQSVVYLSDCFSAACLMKDPSVLRSEDWGFSYQHPKSELLIQIPVLGSEDCSLTDAARKLLTPWQPANICIVIGTLLVHKMKTGEELCSGRWIGGSYEDVSRQWVGAGWFEGQLHVQSWVRRSLPTKHTYLAAMRDIPQKSR
jgi:hypothetical protein